MSVTIQIENVDATRVISFTSAASDIQVRQQGLERPLSRNRKDPLVTRVYRLRVEGTDRDDARESTNSLVQLLRQAYDWINDDLESESVFLREGAEGESATRSLITDFAAVGKEFLSGLDAYQTDEIGLYIDVAITTRKRNEESMYTTAIPVINDGPGAIGRRYLLGNLGHTDDSRMKLIIRSTAATSLERIWIGLKQYEGEDFQYLWKFHNYSGLWNGTTPTTSSGSYGTNVLQVTFSNTQMLRRAMLAMANVYAAAGETYTSHGKGEFIGLLRYKMTGAGTFLARMGITYFSETAVAYNEPRLLTTSTDWRLAPLGVIKFPPRGHRHEINLAFLFETLQIFIDAQRLSGSANLILDSITWIPYRHFIHISDVVINSANDLYLVTHEDDSVEAYSTTGVALTQYGTVREQRNWLMPPIKVPDGVTPMIELVMAAERSSSHVYNDNMSLFSASIYEAFEAFNG